MRNGLKQNTDIAVCNMQAVIFFASDLESDLNFAGERLEKFRKNPAQVGE